MFDQNLLKYAVIIDLTQQEKLSPTGRVATANERAQAAKCIDIIARAAASVPQNELRPNSVMIWAEPELGEGALFRSMASGLNRVIKLRSHVIRYDHAALRNHIEKLASDFIPVAFSLNVLDRQHRLKAPIDAYRALYEVIEETRTAIFWHLRRDTSVPPTIDLPDIKVAQVMEQLQDASLEPAGWIVDMPKNPVMTRIFESVAHIDGRENVSINFSLSHLHLPPADESDLLSRETQEEIQRIAHLHGNTKALLGPEDFDLPIQMMRDEVITSQEAIQAVASRIRQATDILTNTFATI